ERDIEVTAGGGEGTPGRGRALARGRRASEIEVRKRTERPDLEGIVGAAVRARRAGERPDVFHLAGDLVAEVGQLDARQPGERRRARQLDGAEPRHHARPILRPELAPQRPHATGRQRRQRLCGRRDLGRPGGERQERRHFVVERRRALAALVGDRGPARERDRIRRRHPEAVGEDARGLGAAAGGERLPARQRWFGRRRRSPRDRRAPGGGRRQPDPEARRGAPHEPASAGPTTRCACRTASISPRKARKRGYSSGATRARETSRNERTRTTSPSALTSRWKRPNAL